MRSLPILFSLSKIFNTTNSPLEAQGQINWDVVLIAIGVWIVLFFLCRETVCWYFKINKITSQLEDIKNLLKKSIEKK